MKENFLEIINNSTDKHLEIISQDCIFYSERERLIALNELKKRDSLSKELAKTQKEIETSINIEEDMKREIEFYRHKLSYKDLIPTKGYLYTPLLIYINSFIFVLMVLSGVNFFTPLVGDLINWGGNFKIIVVLYNQYWRLFTSIFIHAGIWHLLFNLFALLFAGSILERAIGKNKFIIVYLISGIVASISSIIVNINVVSVGASGAIFGLFGMLFILLVFKKFNVLQVPVKSLLATIIVYVLFSILNGFMEKGIDNAAHIGGLICGIILGLIYCLVPKLHSSKID